MLNSSQTDRNKSAQYKVKSRHYKWLLLKTAYLLKNPTTNFSSTHVRFWRKGRHDPVTTCCFSPGIALKIVAFSLETSCLCCHEKEMWQRFSRLLSRQFPACFDHVRVMYHDQETFDSSQGHVTKNQPMAVPV